MHKTQSFDIVNPPKVWLTKKKSVSYISTNKYYSGMHWTVRNKIKDAWHDEIKMLVNTNCIEKYTVPVKLTFYWNTRYDLDNNGIMRKMIIDGLVEAGVLVDDTKKFVKAIDERLIEEKVIRIRITNWVEEH